MWDQALACLGSQHFTLAKKRWRLTEQGDPRNYLEQVDTVSMWRTNYASLDVFSDKVHEARQRHPDLVVASLGAQREDKSGGVVSARVLFGVTHGITVNTRIIIRDQERGLFAADLKRVMREKSRVGVPTHRSHPNRRTGLASPRVSSGSWWFSFQ